MSANEVTKKSPEESGEPTLNDTGLVAAEINIVVRGDISEQEEAEVVNKLKTSIAELRKKQAEQDEFRKALDAFAQFAHNVYMRRIIEMCNTSYSAYWKKHFKHLN